jgi:preprotein translocase subunit SecF
MIDFMSKRKYFFALSIFVILAGLVGLLVNGLQLDIQFQGGTVIQLQMKNNDYNISELESRVGGLLNKPVSAQRLETYNPEDAGDRINILMLKLGGQTLSEKERDEVVGMLRENYPVADDPQMQIDSVEPFIGKEMMQKGITAALIASGLIILYVWYRFSLISGLAAAITAVIALIHDTLVMFSLYAIFRLPVNESFVAAVLMILGYSINNTIVIYDRIRENAPLMSKARVDELVNTSIKQSLSRSINTTVTTLICILVVYIFASINSIQSLKDFSLPIIAGLIAGTYSSLFIATSLWYVWAKSHPIRRRRA